MSIFGKAGVLRGPHRRLHHLHCIQLCHDASARSRKCFWFVRGRGTARENPASRRPGSRRGNIRMTSTNSFQEKFDAKMAGNLHRRRMMKFMPADFRLIEYRQPLKDQYDEWLARVICSRISWASRPRIHLGRRRRNRPAAAGPDAEHSCFRGNQDARGGAAELGLGGDGKAGQHAPPPALGKYNPYHDEQGRFTTSGRRSRTVS